MVMVPRTWTCVDLRIDHSKHRRPIDPKRENVAAHAPVRQRSCAFRQVERATQSEQRDANSEHQLATSTSATPTKVPINCLGATGVTQQIAATAFSSLLPSTCGRHLVRSDREEQDRGSQARVRDLAHHRSIRCVQNELTFVTGSHVAGCLLQLLQARPPAQPWCLVCPSQLSKPATPSMTRLAWSGKQEIWNAGCSPTCSTNTTSRTSSMNTSGHPSSTTRTS